MRLLKYSVNKYIGIKLQLIPFSHTPYSKYKGKWCRAIYPSQMMHKQPEKKRCALCRGAAAAISRNDLFAGWQE
jgi:hypothetical protein